MDWRDLVVTIRLTYKPDHCIATVWHPDPYGELIDTPHGNVRVLVGEPAYQLTSGEIVPL